MATFHSYMNSMNIALELHFCCVLCFLPNVSGKDLNIIDSHKKMRPHSALWKQWKFHLDIQETFIRVLLWTRYLTMTLKRILLVKLAAGCFLVFFFVGVKRCGLYGEVLLQCRSEGATMTGACWLPKFTEQIATFYKLNFY